MEELFNDIIRFLLPRNDLFLYIFLFLSATVENLFPPIPGDTITALGAFLVGTGRLSYLPVFVATTTGSVTGFMTLVVAGRILNREFFIKRDYAIFSAQSIVSAERWFSRYGPFVVLANRFMPGVRSVISLVAGITRLNLPLVLLLSSISAAIWNLIWIQAGFMLGNNWETVWERAGSLIRRYNIGAGILIASLLAILFIVKMIKKRRSGPEDGSSSPSGGIDSGK